MEKGSVAMGQKSALQRFKRPFALLLLTTFQLCQVSAGFAFEPSTIRATSIRQSPRVRIGMEEALKQERLVAQGTGFEESTPVPKSIRVLVAEDQAIVRDMLVALIQDAADDLKFTITKKKFQKLQI